MVQYAYLCAFVVLNTLMTPLLANAQEEVTANCCSPSPDSGQRNVVLTITVLKPKAGLEPNGRAQLFSKGHLVGAGRYTFDPKLNKAVAQLDFARDRESRTYGPTTLQLDSGLPIEVKGNFKVSPTVPLPLKHLEFSGEDPEVVRLQARIQPATDQQVELCAAPHVVAGSNSEEVPLTVRILETGPSPNKELNVSLEVQRPEMPIGETAVVLELCDTASNQWVYAGPIPGLVPIEQAELKVEPAALGTNGWKPARLHAAISPNLFGAKGEGTILAVTPDSKVLAAGQKIPFELAGNELVFQLKQQCTKEVWLSRLSIEVKDQVGVLHRFSPMESVVLLCTPPGAPPPSPMPGVFWSFLGILLSVAVGTLLWKLGFLRIGREAALPKPTPPASENVFFSGKEDRPLPGSWGRSISELLQQQLGPVKSELSDQIRDLGARFPDQILPPPATQGGKTEASTQAKTEPSAPRKPLGESERSLLDLVNGWWHAGADRTQLPELIRSSGTSIKIFRALNISKTLQTWTNRTFSFMPSDGPQEWLWHGGGGREILAVPADPRQFQTEDSLKFVAALFDGFGDSLWDVKFGRVLHACRLRPEDGSGNQYRLVEKGLLDLSSQTAVPFTIPSQNVAVTVSAPVGHTEASRDVEEALLRRVLEDVLREQHEHLASLLALQFNSQAPAHRVPESPLPVDALNQLPIRLEEVAQAVARVDRQNTVRDAEISGHVDQLATRIAELQARLARLPSLLAVELQPALAEQISRSLTARPLSDQVAARPASQPDLLPVAVAAVDSMSKPLPPSHEDSRPTAQPPLAPEGPSRLEAIQAAEEFLKRLTPSFPVFPNYSPPANGVRAGESSAYLWRLAETKEFLQKASADRGWIVDLVHIKASDGSPPEGQLIQVLEIQELSEDFSTARCQGWPFKDAYLFQFGLRIREDHGELIALSPAIGVVMEKHADTYSRLMGGKVLGAATRVTRVKRPAVLRSEEPGDLYTLVMPLEVEAS